MIHGNGMNGAWWDQMGFPVPFRQAGIPYDNSINLSELFIGSNATTLASEIPCVAREFRTEHVHLVAHSKGGLDTRGFLKILTPIRK